jgi:hypothetical protein
VDDNGFYFTTKNIVLNNNNLLTEKEMNDIQNIPLKKGGIITLNDFEKVVTSNNNNDDYITYEDPNPQNHSEFIESWNKLPISNYRFNEKNGLVGAKDTVVKLLANKGLSTDDRLNLLNVDKKNT